MRNFGTKALLKNLQNFLKIEYFVQKYVALMKIVLCHKNGQFCGRR